MVSAASLLYLTILPSDSGAGPGTSFTLTRGFKKGFKKGKTESEVAGSDRTPLAGSVMATEMAPVSLAEGDTAEGSTTTKV